ncbi:Hypothetical protein A7982_04796 [Minicystis rosea]|nr:Hypothetical protein A7982_04796 [Minicystis rosea]
MEGGRSGAYGQDPMIPAVTSSKAPGSVYRSSKRGFRHRPRRDDVSSLASSPMLTEETARAAAPLIGWS